jgi:hypothetical protein
LSTGESIDVPRDNHHENRIRIVALQSMTHMETVPPIAAFNAPLLALVPYALLRKSFKRLAH